MYIYIYIYIYIHIQQAHVQRTSTMGHVTSGRAVHARTTFACMMQWPFMRCTAGVREIVSVGTRGHQRCSDLASRAERAWTHTRSVGSFDCVCEGVARIDPSTATRAGSRRTRAAHQRLAGASNCLYWRCVALWIVSSPWPGVPQCLVARGSEAKDMPTSCKNTYLHDIACPRCVYACTASTLRRAEGDAGGASWPSSWRRRSRTRGPAPPRRLGAVLLTL